MKIEGSVLVVFRFTIVVENVSIKFTIFCGFMVSKGKFLCLMSMLPMPAWSGATSSFRRHPARRRLQRCRLRSSSSSQLVIRRTRLSTVVSGG